MITKTPCGMKEHYEWSIPESRQTTNVFLLSSSVVFAQSSSSFILSSALAHCFFATSKSHEVLKSSRSKSMVSFVTPFSSLVHIAYMLFMVAEKATLQLLLARSLFAYRISYSRAPWRIRISRIAYSLITNRIRAAHSVFAYRISHSRGP